VFLKMKPIQFLILAAAASTLMGCTTKYKTWQGGGIQVGRGGACETVEGIEVWSHGTPNRPYRIVGLIEDSRPGGVIPMAMRSSAVARQAKAKGADGLIIVNEGKEYRGTYSSMNSHSTLNAATTIQGNTQFIGNNAYTNGTVTSTGGISTYGSGMSVPLMQANGTYQAFKYVTATRAEKVE
jgi:hypothetical protein